MDVLQVWTLNQEWIVVRVEPGIEVEPCTLVFSRVGFLILTVFWFTYREDITWNVIAQKTVCSWSSVSGHWFSMPGGRLSLFTVGHEDQWLTCKKALMFKLHLIWQRAMFEFAATPPTRIPMILCNQKLGIETFQSLDLFHLWIHLCRCHSHPCRLQSRWTSSSRRRWHAFQWSHLFSQGWNWLHWLSDIVTITLWQILDIVTIFPCPDFKCLACPACSDNCLVTTIALWLLVVTISNNQCSSILVKCNLKYDYTYVSSQTFHLILS